VKLDCFRLKRQRRTCLGISLVETLISFTIAGVVTGSTIVCYLQFARQAEWSAMSMAAQGLAIQRLEQTRGARWDTQAYPQTADCNQFVSANFPSLQAVMDVPVSGGTNVLVANVATVISDISTTPPLRQVVVQCTWPFKGRTFTNTILSYRAPDQ
jgi:hypothetical protein